MVAKVMSGVAMDALWYVTIVASFIYFIRYLFSYNGMRRGMKQ
jgi:hypothetical protein